MKNPLQASGHATNNNPADLLTAFEDVLDLFAPYATAFPKGLGVDIYLRAVNALAEAKEANAPAAAVHNAAERSVLSV